MHPVSCSCSVTHKTVKVEGKEIVSSLTVSVRPQKSIRAQEEQLRGYIKQNMSHPHHSLETKGKKIAYKQVGEAQKGIQAVSNQILLQSEDLAT